MPKRIQLRRTKGWRLREESLAANGLLAVKVDRTTPWGNPFKVGKDGTAEQCVRLFRRLLTDGNFDLGSNHKLFVFTPERLRADLRGINLACWCKPGAPCHADVLLEIANSAVEQHTYTQSENDNG
ncbi:MAG: DUF4326 domain-containing protein [Acidobacteriaceae bacterium]